ncbi:hypothetical protein AUP68_15038 [Ilyonectria robusta]
MLNMLQSAHLRGPRGACRRIPAATVNPPQLCLFSASWMRRWHGVSWYYKAPGTSHFSRSYSKSLFNSLTIRERTCTVHTSINHFCPEDSYCSISPTPHTSTYTTQNRPTNSNNMPARQEAYSVSIPMSVPPPQNLSSYSRFMHDHTKRQMQAFGANPGSRRHGNPTTMNGTSHNNNHIGYHA